MYSQRWKPKNLPEDDRLQVRIFFPEARSVIVFGKEVPNEVYRKDAKGKTRGMLMIAESLDRAARLLALPDARGGIRTRELLREQILSLPPLTAWIPSHTINFNCTIRDLTQ